MIKEKLTSLNARIYPSHMFQGPSWLVLGVNNVCNLHCKMCDVGTQNLESNFAINLVGTHPLHMPIELFTSICDQTARDFPKTKIGYAFTEPLVYKHLEESLKYAQGKGLFTSVTTNALTLKQRAKMLCESGLGSIGISLDGPESIHNEIRGNSKSFQKAIEGIEELLKYKNPPEISVYCVITEWNIGHLKEFADFFSNYPLKILGFMHTNFTPKNIADNHNLVYGNSYPATDSNVDEINIENYNLPLLWDEILALKKEKYPFQLTFSPEVSSFERLQLFYERPDILWGKRCNDAYSNIMIKSDGSVIPSHGRCYNLPVGNMNDTSLKDIWNSKILSKFRTDLNNAGGLFPACSRCCSAY